MRSFQIILAVFLVLAFLNPNKPEDVSFWADAILALGSAVLFGLAVWSPR